MLGHLLREHKVNSMKDSLTGIIIDREQELEMPDHIIHLVWELLSTQIENLDSHRRILVAVEFHHGGSLKDMPGQVRCSSGTTKDTSGSFDSLFVSTVDINDMQDIPLIDAYIACT